MDKKPHKPVIVTGQQIGLLGGPLYTVYKILGAVRLAEQLNGSAVFWMETNDADFNEINHLVYMDASDQLNRLEWEKETSGYPVGLIEIDQQLIDGINSFFNTLPQTEFTPRLKEIVLSCYQPGYTLSRAFTELTRQLFGFTGITLFDPMDSDFRKFTRPILLNEADNTPPGSQCNLFCLMDNRRMALFRTETGYRLRDGVSVDISHLDLLPNVYTRNVCQDSWFNTHTYVAGPSEIKYIDELDEIYLFHGVMKSRIQPRMSLTLVEPRQKRYMATLGLTTDELLSQSIEELSRYILERFASFNWPEVNERSRRHVDEFIMGISALGLGTKDLRYLIDKKLKELIGVKRKEEKSTLDAWLKKGQFLSESLLPFGLKQERVFNVFQYMNRYGGLDFIRYLYENHDFNQELLEVGNG